MNTKEWLQHEPLTEMDTRTSGVFVITEEGKVGVLAGRRIIGSDSCGVSVSFGDKYQWLDVEQLRRATELEIDAEVERVRSGKEEQTESEPHTMEMNMMTRDKEEEAAVLARVDQLQNEADDDEATVAHPAGTEAPTPGYVITARTPGWGHVELYGHRSYVGELYDVHRWGSDHGLVIEIDREGNPISGKAHHFGGNSFYAVHPLTKEEAIVLVREREPRAQSIWSADEFEDERNDDDDDDPGF